MIRTAEINQRLLEDLPVIRLPKFVPPGGGLSIWWEGQRQRVEASTGPVRYLAVMAGLETEAAVRWLILLMVLCCDPAAIALTIAASRRD
jgi:hypothetical protein